MYDACTLYAYLDSSVDLSSSCPFSFFASVEMWTRRDIEEKKKNEKIKYSKKISQRNYDEMNSMRLAITCMIVTYFTTNFIDIVIVDQIGRFIAARIAVNVR